MAWAITAAETNMIILGVRWGRGAGAVAVMDRPRIFSEERGYCFLGARQFPGAQNIFA